MERQKRKGWKVVLLVDVLMVGIIAGTAFGSLITTRAGAPAETTATTEQTETIATVPTETIATVPTETQPETIATEPPVTLYDVPLDKELQLHIIEEAENHGIDPAVIFAMAFYESSYNPKASNGGGYTLGLLQVQPRWHKKRMERLNCPDLLDPYQNVTVAVDYLAEQIARYDGDVAKGVTAYNKGHYAGKVTYYAKAVLNKAAKLETYQTEI